ncbi:MAG: hypothetical protein IPL61_37955 [Myxococcales bacterium]|nr:hypothetical protein [Myxococcales bacterium]
MESASGRHGRPANRTEVIGPRCAIRPAGHPSSVRVRALTAGADLDAGAAAVERAGGRVSADAAGVV